MTPSFLQAKFSSGAKIISNLKQSLAEFPWQSFQQSAWVASRIWVAYHRLPFLQHPTFGFSKKKFWIFWVWPSPRLFLVVCFFIIYRAISLNFFLLLAWMHIHQEQISYWWSQRKQCNLCEAELTQECANGFEQSKFLLPLKTPFWVFAWL